MTDQELTEWTARRAELFPNLRIPSHANAAILHDTRGMDFDIAMQALKAYSEAKPYRGFWLTDWMRHYDKARTERGDRQTDSGLRAAAAAVAEREKDEQAIREQQAEIDAYRRLPPETIDRATKALENIGYQPDPRSRAWRFIVLAWSRGEDVEPYRVYPEPMQRKIAGSIRTLAEQISDLRGVIHAAELQIGLLERMRPAL